MKRLLFGKSMLLVVVAGGIVCHSAANQPPNANSQSYVALAGASLGITLTGSDPDGDPITFQILSMPTLGSLTGAPPSVVYRAPNVISGSVTDSFTFVANDGQTSSLPATVSIGLIGSTNKAPTAYSQTISNYQNTNISITLSGSDQNGEALTYSIVSFPTNGTLSGTPPSVVYQPNAGAVGRDQFKFTVSDSQHTSAAATVTIYMVPGDTLSFLTGDSVASEVLNPDGSTNTGSFTVRRVIGNDALQFRLNVSGNAVYGRDYYTIPALGISSNGTTPFIALPADLPSITFTLVPNISTVPDISRTAGFSLASNPAFNIGSPSSSSIAIQGAPGPAVQMMFPPDGACFASALNIELRAYVTNTWPVRFVADGQSLLYTNPMSFNYMFFFTTNFCPGTHTVYAIVTNPPFTALTSAPVHFTVLGPRCVGGPLVGSDASADLSFAIDGNGALFDWGGTGENGLLGDGARGSTIPAYTTRPIQLPVPSETNRWRKVAGGARHGVALDDAGRVFCWGANMFGQLGAGLPSTSNSLSPLLVPFPSGVTRWIDIAAGYYHNLAIASNGVLYAWGSGSFGALGIGGITNCFTPQRVTFPPGVTAWSGIAAGLPFSAALGNDGNIYVCGSSGSGVLGIGPATNTLTFHTPVTLPPGVSSWTAVAAGQTHVLAIANDGSLYGWGYANYGQLGSIVGSFASVPTPAVVPPGVKGWKAIAAGINHSLMLDNSGQLYSCGQNGYGQLGRMGTNYAPALVTPPAGVSSWRGIAAGMNHSLAIADNCGVYTWGNNSVGQLGNGIPSYAHVPTSVSSLQMLCPDGGPCISMTAGPAPSSRQIQFTGVAGVAYDVEASMDMVNWQTVGSATESSPGQFQFQDDASLSLPVRYFRLRVR